MRTRCVRYFASTPEVGATARSNYLSVIWVRDSEVWGPGCGVTQPRHGRTQLLDAPSFLCASTLALIPAHVRARTHACTHARTHAHTHAHTHTRTHTRTQVLHWEVQEVDLIGGAVELGLLLGVVGHDGPPLLGPGAGLGSRVSEARGQGWGRGAGVEQEG